MYKHSIHLLHIDVLLGLLFWRLIKGLLLPWITATHILKPNKIDLLVMTF